MSWKNKLALWLLKLDKSQVVILPAMDEDFVESVKMFIKQVGSVDASGEYKRAQVLRALMNRHPEVSEKICALAIEVVLCGAVS